MNNRIFLLFPFYLISLAVSLHSCTGFQDIPIPDTEQFEQNLSTYGIYQGNLGDLTPSTDYHLLELNSSLFSNYTEKQRLVKLPTGTQMVKVDDGLPEFPDGTILVKTFYYFNDERDESLGIQVIETRLEIKTAGKWNVGTYIWNESQTEATLELNGHDKQVSWINAEGENQIIDYHFPDQRECVSCHQQYAEVLPVGPSLRNLNIEITDENRAINQLEYLQNNGLLDSFDISQVSELPDYHALDASISQRARAYLDMNCAHCHNPFGWSEAAEQRLDLRFETSLADSKIENNADEISRLTQEGEMPFLGNTVIDEEGVNLILEYLRSL